jgi:hypothetical protein
MVKHERLPVTDAELSRPALMLAQRFVQRWDLFARQLDDGRYICVHEPMNVSHLFSHLKGEITLGTYVLDEHSQARFLVLDADDPQGWESLGSLAKALAAENVTAYLETSRRGGHLWLFLAHAVAGKDVRAFGQGLLAAHHIEGVELFPKQDQLASGPGSLVRMPFGVHRLTGQRYTFVTADGGHLAPTIRRQIQLLAESETVPEATFEGYGAIAAKLNQTESRLSPDRVRRVSDEIKDSISVFEFVSRYLPLTSTGNSATGLCPFHDDHHASLGVNVQENYWHCFAGCGGGSVIDFWMKWQNCDFSTAVTQLAKMLL